MTTLSETASFSHKAIVRAGKLIALIVGLYIVFRIGGAVFNVVLPPAPPPPTVAFGKLPQLDLSEGIASPNNLAMKVETISGDIPNLGTSAKVFAVKNADVTFGNLNDAAQIATRLGFSQIQDIGQGRARFADAKGDSKFLTIEAATNNFKLESDFLDTAAILNSRPKSLENAINMATDFVKNFGVSNVDYPSDLISTALFSVDRGKLVNAISLSSANVVQVIFRPADLDKIGIVYLNVNDPIVWVMVSDKAVLAGEKSSNQIQQFKFSTYPLKGGPAAYDELKSGKGVFNKLPRDNNFIIRNVRLAYVEGRKLQPFLQPVYIFEGDDMVSAFVAAVGDNWIELGQAPK